MSTLVKAHEFFGQMQRENQAFRLLNANIGDDDALLRGTYRRTTIRHGLTLHYSDVVNLCDLQTEAESSPHLGIKLFFQGGVSARFGDQDIPMPCRALQPDRWVPSATLFYQKEHELFRRRAAIGDRVRKLTIKILPEWLESGGVFAGTGAESLKQFTSQRLAVCSWQPSPSLLSLAMQAVRPPDLDPCLTRLYVESRVLGIIIEAFAQLSPAQPSHAAGLNAHEQNQLQRAEDLLQSGHASLSIDAIAAEIGVGINTLQRLFHVAHGMSVFHYVKTLKLDEARKSLERGETTIAQAAHLAGYNSPANFATAFKRVYGFSPKEARRCR